MYVYLMAFGKSGHRCRHSTLCQSSIIIRYSTNCILSILLCLYNNSTRVQLGVLISHMSLYEYLSTLKGNNLIIWPRNLFILYHIQGGYFFAFSWRLVTVKQLAVSKSIEPAQKKILKGVWNCSLLC